MLYADNVLPAEDAEKIIELARPTMRAAKIKFQPKDRPPLRISLSTFLTQVEQKRHPAVRKLLDSVSSFVGLPPEMAAPVQVVTP